MSDPVLEKGVQKSRAMREDMREEDSRARAARKAAEIREQLGDENFDYVDEFRAPRSPDGWEYQWKRKEVFGKTDQTYTNDLLRHGWSVVPSDRHPELMPKGYDGEEINNKGMVLMECPKELIADARNREKRKAAEEVSKKAAQLNGDPGTLLNDQHKDTRPRLKKGYAPMPVPE